LNTAESSPSSPSAGEPLTVAAVDLGSNSFHLIVAQATDADLIIIDRLKETVRLAEGLGTGNRLTSEVRSRAIACLERFGQRLRTLRPQHVRAVGTNTLRLARNDEEFRADARRALGHAIEVISGDEEARLIYEGVASTHFSEGKRLVVDIGGGSTELIVGEGHAVLRAHSLYMGCISFTRRYFPKGRITRDAFRQAQTAAGLELESIQLRLRRIGWQTAFGASGTIGAISELLRAAGWTSGEIDLPALKRLRRALVDAGDVQKINLVGLKEDRATVLPGGLAILIAVFKGLDVRGMERSYGALREGVLQDLLGRIRHHDIRDVTIQRFMERFGVDVDQATRVEQTALAIAAQISDTELRTDESRQALTWAARLHEVGLALRYAGYHKHGAYLVMNSDMPGFSTDDQLLLASIIEGHRRDISPDLLAEVSPRRRVLALRLVLVFRLAILLNRGRTNQPTPEVRTSADWGEIELRFAPGWLATHPLTAADLEVEGELLRSVGTTLVVGETAPSA
jgi:exopolyphosphatase/guanosine-5'-triphosphate,3'-diphosphate pyrophosphatase